MPTSLSPSRIATLTRPETLKPRQPCLTLHTPVIYQPRITLNPKSLKSYQILIQSLRANLPDGVHQACGGSPHKEVPSAQPGAGRVVLQGGHED